MELLVTIAYFFLVRLVFFEWKWIKFTLFWKFVAFGLYAAAALTEVTLLGQRAPYSKEMFVQSFVVPMAPEFGGEVTAVYVKSNVPVKKGDPLFQMDPTTFHNKVDKLKAELAAADTNVAELRQQLMVAQANTARVEADLSVARDEFNILSAAAEQNAVSRLRLDQGTQKVQSLEAELRANQAAARKTRLALDSEIGDQHTSVAQVLADLATAEYNLEKTTIVAPSDGYVVNLQLHPGAFIRLKTPVMTFVSTEEQWMVAPILQNGAQYMQPGDSGEVALRMYPGKVFPAVVDAIIWAAGESQGRPSGELPKGHQVRPAMEFFVRLRIAGDFPDHPLRFGANGRAAVYTRKSGATLQLLRKLEIRAQAFLDYVYNPF